MNSAARRKNIEREERLLLRTERESAAGKLLEKIPDLTSLSVAVHELRPDGRVSAVQYIRRIVVEHAPALFEMPCSYSNCKDGGYDVTREILDGLVAQKARFEGEGACRGSCGTGDCARLLRFVATAMYRPRLHDS